ncbi:hypothetical protein [Jiangella alba]|uniref:Uncharacterized protein n=1 Tax=Jiangella alba TaxID=561176 RepID=A0A1H5BYG1_9ACTN|nr:hypothetical protein [Jiangella alba]SED59090.1 hypothetical protein SAMN04488561_0050 [Jiangella alba]
MFIEPSLHHDPHAERRTSAARYRAVRDLVRARRLRRWADRSARLAARLDRRAGATAGAAGAAGAASAATTRPVTRLISAA